MANERTADDRGEFTDPDDMNTTSAASANSTPDPNDEIPVPIAMYPSEIDERAQVVEALRQEANANPDGDVETRP